MNSMNWSSALAQCESSGQGFALITLLGCTGSTPRDHGSKMVVSGSDTYDSIGGGHLEFVAIQAARKQLGNNEASQAIHHFPLGASLGQCCGGSATVLIETFAARAFHVALFGAGHVANALIKILAELPCRVSWVDSRRECFPDALPENITAIVSETPAHELENLPPHSDVLILTHNHQLDFELCIKALAHGHLRHIGLIGSKTKAERFRKRLAHRGNDDASIAAIKCPVGLDTVPGKRPMEVAVSIAGDLIALEHQTRPASSQAGLAWKEIKQHLHGEIDPGGQGYRLPITTPSSFES